jgi:peptidoglycan/LPS O-acetylase OafA/YrhL
VRQRYVYEAFDMRADHLLAGCLLAFVLSSGEWSTLWSRLCSTPLFSLLLAAGLVASTYLVIQHGRIYRDTVGCVIEPVMVALLIPPLIAFRRSIVWSWLNWPWVRYLGRISYSIYLYHQLPLSILENRMRFAPRLIVLAVNLVLIVLIGSGSYYIVEKPFLRWKGRFLRDT